MSPNQRIMLNVAATYGRSLYALALGLFSARWVLAALGNEDFGLYGVVGGLVAFVAFFNNLLSMAVGRFYAFSVGEARAAEDKAGALENSRRWFNTALLIHSVVPVVLVSMGYPIGVWAIRHFLAIPQLRVEACIWVWRFTCLSCFVGMAGVPFKSMYTAKQEIAELTVYSFATTTLNAIFFWYMANHEGEWLVRYSLWMCAAFVLPEVIIAFRAVLKYKECRFRWGYFKELGRIRDICVFANARFITALSSIVLAQGQAILSNRYFGAVFNAAITIGNSVSSHASTLSAAMYGAFWPAITNAAGERDDEKVKRYTFMTCRFGSILVLAFAIPLLLEIDEVLLLWLKTPPDFASKLCIAILSGAVLNHSTDGYYMAVFGKGVRVSFYSSVIGLSGFIGFVATWGLLVSGAGRWGVFAAIIITSLTTLALRLWLGGRLLNYSPREWFSRVAIPLLSLTVGTICIALIPIFVMQRSFLRVVVTSFTSMCAFLPILWWFVLSVDERDYIQVRMKARLFKRGRGAR